MVRAARSCKRFDESNLVPSSRGREMSRRPSQSVRSATLTHRSVAPVVQPIKWETGMPMHDATNRSCARLGLGKNHQELAQFIEGHVNRVANGRIRDLHVVYSDDKIILQGRVPHLSRQATGASSRARSDRRPSSAGQSDRRVLISAAVDPAHGCPRTTSRTHSNGRPNRNPRS